MSVPEGWSRSTASGSASFTDKLNSVVVRWFPASSAPTLDSVRAKEIPRLQQSRRAFELKSIADKTLPAGPSVLVVFRENSAPSSVTGRQYRNDVQRYALFHAGTEVVVELISPVGADNVDPWRKVMTSLRWI
ncbi:MAG: hypothetical protein NVSMB57_13970 [Actinomycetota bacterium]